MARIQAFALFGLVSFAIGASAAPASLQNTTSGGSNLSLDDIINAPIIALPLADSAFTPILAESNQTLIATNPQVLSKINNLPSVISSISAAAATGTKTATATATAKTNTAGPKVRRGAPPPPNYDDTECAYETSAPATIKLLWDGAARRACHEWWGVASDNIYPYSQSPAAYIKEDSFGVLMNIGGSFGFQFEFMVRDNPSPFTEYYVTSMDDCTAELEARITWMFANCLLGDTTGFSSYDDPDSVIVYKAWRYPGLPTGFDPSASDAAPIVI